MPVKPLEAEAPLCNSLEIKHPHLLNYTYRLDIGETKTAWRQTFRILTGKERIYTSLFFFIFSFTF